jgi:protoporphyrinogen/coproporphyrinogen III oxidase
MVKARRAAKAAGAPPARSITFREGLSTLWSSLGHALGDRARTDSPVAWLEPRAGGLCLGLDDGSIIQCDRAVIAAPLGAAAALLHNFRGSAELASELARVPMASLAVVGLGYDRAAVMAPLDGFGYLAAKGAGAPVLGCMFRSSLFPHTAPAGKVLLSVFIGGARHPEAVDTDDESLLRLATNELALRMGTKAQPEEAFIRRWSCAIPQYERGHGRIAAAARDWSFRNPVSIIGNGLTGLSLPDCITAGRSEADRLAALTGDAATRREDVCVPA